MAWTVRAYISSLHEYQHFTYLLCLTCQIVFGLDGDCEKYYYLQSAYAEACAITASAKSNNRIS